MLPQRDKPFGELLQLSALFPSPVSFFLEQEIKFMAQISKLAIKTPCSITFATISVIRVKAGQKMSIHWQKITNFGKTS